MQIKTHISKGELEGHWNAPYKVRTVVPSADDPYMKEFNVFQEELNEYLRNYNEYDEFIISMEVSKGKLEKAKENMGKKIKFLRTDFKDAEPFRNLLKQLSIKQEKMNEVEEIELEIFDGIYSYPFLKTIIREKLGKKGRLVISRVVARITD
jgi:predicted nuclease with TOPRIM domain